MRRHNNIHMKTKERREGDVCIPLSLSVRLASHSVRTQHRQQHVKHQLETRNIIISSQREAEVEGW